MTNLEASLYSCICTFPPEERLASSLPTAIIGAWFLGKQEFPYYLSYVYEPPHILQGRNLKDKKFPRFSTYFQRLLKDLLETNSY